MSGVTSAGYGAYSPIHSTPEINPSDRAKRGRETLGHLSDEQAKLARTSGPSADTLVHGIFPQDSPPPPGAASAGHFYQPFLRFGMTSEQVDFQRQMTDAIDGKINIEKLKEEASIKIQQGDSTEFYEHALELLVSIGNKMIGLVESFVQKRERSSSPAHDVKASTIYDQISEITAESYHVYASLASGAYEAEQYDDFLDTYKQRFDAYEATLSEELTHLGMDDSAMKEVFDYMDQMLNEVEFAYSQGIQQPMPTDDFRELYIQQSRSRTIELMGLHSITSIDHITEFHPATGEVIPDEMKDKANVYVLRHQQEGSITFVDLSSGLQEEAAERLSNFLLPPHIFQGSLKLLSEGSDKSVENWQKKADDNPNQYAQFLALGDLSNSTGRGVIYRSI